jgi:glutamate---cysteine ligase / carboxylate-amine ligase
VNHRLQFMHSEPLTVGAEIEVMLIDAASGDLVSQALALKKATDAGPYQAQLKLEITQSMFELNTSVHSRADQLAVELANIATYLDGQARAVGARICGGGVHPFHSWTEQQISPTNRFEAVADRYGYLAKQFTVFSQHVHIGVNDGDQAVRLTHALTRYVPQLIALTAASPIYRGVDTSFDCCRLNFISSFPLSGHAPQCTDWSAFLAYVDRMLALGIIESLKDFYWDVRPKPNYGTVEVRVCDTPLDVQLATDIVAYVQALVYELLRHRGSFDFDELYLPYAYNRFQACRFGLDGRIVEPWKGARVRIADDVRHTIDQLANAARDLGSTTALNRLYQRAGQNRNGSSWIREHRALNSELSGLMLECADRWIDRARSADLTGV